MVSALVFLENEHGLLPGNENTAESQNDRLCDPIWTTWCTLEEANEVGLEQKIKGWYEKYGPGSGRQLAPDYSKHFSVTEDLKGR